MADFSQASQLGAIPSQGNAVGTMYVGEGYLPNTLTMNPPISGILDSAFSLSSLINGAEAIKTTLTTQTTAPNGSRISSASQQDVLLGTPPSVSLVGIEISVQLPSETASGRRNNRDEGW
jgi:hypothetical protein